jgi:hypothetical protein
MVSPFGMEFSVTNLTLKKNEQASLIVTLCILIYTEQGLNLLQITGYPDQWFFL